MSEPGRPPEDRRIEQPDGAPPSKRRYARLVAFLLLCLALAAAWRWTPLAQWLTGERLRGLLDPAHAGRGLPVLVVLLYVGGSLLVVPITLLVLATAAVFGPWTGFAYCLIGCLSGAVVTYVLGRLLGQDTVRRLAGKRLNRLSERLARRGILTILVIRNLPLAPFTIVNLAAGASPIRFRDFVVGTVLGMTPGILAITVFTNRLKQVFQSPDLPNLLLLVGAAAVILIGGMWIRKRAGEASD